MKVSSEMLEKPRKRRAQWDKVGKYRYLLRKLRSLRRDVRAVLVLQKYLVKGLEHEFMFDREFVEDLVCRDEIDRDILEVLKGAGEGGILPQDVAKQLEISRLTPWKVTKRIYRINRRLDQLLGQKAAEKHGMMWALTSFIREAWGSLKEELIEESGSSMDQ